MRAHIDPEQIEWLKTDLRKTDKRCIIFSHQSLENTVPNRESIREILESENKRTGYKKIVAAFSGHDHTNYEKIINGIAYIQINSASNQWVGDSYQCENRFSAEINKQHPSLKYVTPWEDCLYATVTLNKKSVKLKGTESQFIPPHLLTCKSRKTISQFRLFHISRISNSNFNFDGTVGGQNQTQCKKRWRYLPSLFTFFMTGSSSLPTL